jgi:hypothetical protein
MVPKSTVNSPDLTLQLKTALLCVWPFVCGGRWVFPDSSSSLFKGVEIMQKLHGSKSKPNWNRKENNQQKEKNPKTKIKTSEKRLREEIKATHHRDKRSKPKTNLH